MLIKVAAVGYTIRSKWQRTKDRGEIVRTLCRDDKMAWEKNGMIQKWHATKWHRCGKSMFDGKPAPCKPHFPGSQEGTANRRTYGLTYFNLIFPKSDRSDSSDHRRKGHCIRLK